METKPIKSVSYSRYGYYFTLPFIIAYLCFGVVPLIYSFTVSFTDIKSLQQITTANFVGLRNYFNAIQSALFWKYVGNALIIWIMYTPFQMAIAFFLAVSFTTASYKVPGVKFFRLMMYMPSIVSGVAIGLLFLQLFAFPVGVINNMLKLLDLKPFHFFADTWATRGVIALICLWQSYGGTMILIMATIMGINPSIFEAAQVDGANDKQTFFYITLPNLRTVCVYLAMGSISAGLQNFELIRTITGNSPSQELLTPVYYIYNTGIVNGRYAQGSATAIILGFILTFFSSFAFIWFRDADKPYKKTKGVKQA